MVPKRRKSKAAKRARRSHLAIRPVNLVPCPKCGKASMPHRACSNCGYVNAKVAIKIKIEES
ncbi:MAG: 50S ribosomal protein L32 [Planctomycetota bacterium]